MVLELLLGNLASTQDSQAPPPWRTRKAETQTRATSSTSTWWEQWHGKDSAWHDRRTRRAALHNERKAAAAAEAQAEGKGKTGDYAQDRGIDGSCFDKSASGIW